ncbi:MAG: hypothetical protein LCH67_16905 [Bacteroidetes bacterium]|nr:hypothetical protein [Bacteroidota bacterium]
MKKIGILILAILSVTIYSCEKADEIGPNDKNSLSLNFDNMVGTEDLVMGSKTYTNTSGEKFTVTTLNYFISNIELKKADGSVLKYADQYFLVKESDKASQTVTLNDVPAADYVSLTYTVGVDSAKSVTDVSKRTGVLDPASYGADNMYWSWNSGYIFFKMEGNSDNITATNKKYQFHIGGFGGLSAPTANNLKKITVDLSASNAKVRKNIAPEVHISVDVQKVFGANIKLAASPIIMNPTLGVPVSANYKNSFALEHVHNDAM